MATNTTIPPEEEKKPLTPPADYQPTTFAPPAPTATYEPIYDELQRQIADYVNRTDPQKQAEQDARTQRGRNFWTGANLFANVIANAINAGGTAKGAPSMTWNDSQQKMFDTWQTTDRELKADRKAAQQRLEALRMQDAQFRMADAQARDKAALDAYNRNYEAGEKAKAANWSRKVKEYDTQQQQEREDAIRKENQDFQREGWDRADRRARMGGGRTATTKPATDHSVQLGSIDIPAKDEKDAQRIRRDVANKIVDRMNAEIEKRNKEKEKYEPKEELIAKPKNDKEAQAIIYQNGGLYDDDTDFRKDINGTYGIKDIYAEEQPQQQRHWMDREFDPSKPGPGYLTNNGTIPTQKTPWKFPKK